MVTIDQLKEWDADRLGVVADELHTRRGTLTDLADEVDAGRPPSSWVGGASVYAEQDHDQLATRLTDQVAELNMVISALDTASGQVRSARTMLDDALSRASTNGFTVSSTGAVTSNRTYTDADERADAQGVADEIAQAITDALTNAAEADSALAASLRSARTSDVDAGGGLGDQDVPDALRGLTTEEQVDYLLDHPDLAAILVPSLPDPLKHELGQGLSDLLDSEVNDDDFDLDDETVDRLSTLLDSYGGDPEIASSLYEDLGADGTVATLGSIESYLRLGGTDPDKVADLAADMRRTLATAGEDTSFDDHGFGEDLVRHATWQLSDEQRDAFEERYPHYSGSGASILTYLMEDHSLDGDLVRGVAEQLDEFERSGNDLGAEYWYGHNGHSPLTADDEYDGWYDDPMAAALGNLGSHPEDGYQFLTDDPERQDYYFQERNWEADGFEGITQLAEGVGTDEGVNAQHPEQQAELVSRFFHGIAGNESFSIENAEAGSPHLAELMKHYTPAMDAALRAPGEGEPGAVPFEDAFLGTAEHYPRLFAGDLEELMQVAVSTDDGATSIAEGIGGFQQQQINGAAVQMADDPDDYRLGNQLRDSLERSANLQGLAEWAVGSVEIGDAQEHDARVQAFSDLIGEAAGLVPLPGADVVGELGSRALDAAWGQGVDLGTGALGDAMSQTEDATREAETRASYGVTQAKLGTFHALAEAGVIPESEIPQTWRTESGGLIDIADIPPEDRSAYAQSAMSVASGYVTNMDLETSYKDAFLDYYGDTSD
ncbi:MULTISPECIES: hypothetical protein [unclassified Nocardioides]|uniref:hypothetical protein n=1 Tax=unclassified Nocardioides TaxID=2615069 RepID=UPI0036235C50